MGWWIGLAVGAAIVALYLVGSVRIVNEYERGVVFLFGRIHAVREPGLHFVPLIVERMVRVSLQVTTIDIPARELITSDSVTVNVNAVAWYRVVERDGSGVVSISVERRRSVVTWVVAMMALFWLLALCAVGVTFLVVTGRRDWESRHLAWLGAMIFALVAFRNAAPGSPPIGTFLDFRAFFPAVALVALSLVALVATFLVRPRDELGL